MLLEALWSNSEGLREKRKMENQVGNAYNSFLVFE